MAGEMGTNSSNPASVDGLETALPTPYGPKGRMIVMPKDNAYWTCNYLENFDGTDLLSGHIVMLLGNKNHGFFSKVGRWWGENQNK
ncbi:MAG: hypothetical protein KKG10_18650 [Proteobacteria bacterium]|nr:hypothetical protein [Pseudomonadota bacterium]